MGALDTLFDVSKAPLPIVCLGNGVGAQTYVSYRMFDTGTETAIMAVSQRARYQSLD